MFRLMNVMAQKRQWNESRQLLSFRGSTGTGFIPILPCSPEPCFTHAFSAVSLFQTLRANRKRDESENHPPEFVPQTPFLQCLHILERLHTTTRQVTLQKPQLRIPMNRSGWRQAKPSPISAGPAPALALPLRNGRLADQEH